MGSSYDILLICIEIQVEFSLMSKDYQPTILILDYGIAMDLRLDDAILEDNVFYSSSVEIASTSNTVAVKPRTKFPETWLWKAATSR